MKFSANLGFLWTELSLPDAIRAAGSAGFDTVECRWPYEADREAVRTALEETHLPMLGLNTHRGDTTAGENGLAALPGRQDDAVAGIDQAIEYANDLDVQCIHVMAGFAQGEKAEQTFVVNLQYACDKAKLTGKTILIEPLNRHDAPGYFLRNTDQAIKIIDQVKAENLKLMFDCYHVGRTEGDVIHRLNALKPRIGHIQFASVPFRGEPGSGELDYSAVFAAIEAMGWTQPLGAEYKPGGDTDATLAWLKRWQ